MSVSVDSVVSTMLNSGGEVIVREKTRIASNLGVPSHVSSQWFTEHSRSAVESHDIFLKILGSWVVQSGVQANIGRLTKIMQDMQLLSVAEAISKLGNLETRITMSAAQQPPIPSSSNVTNRNANSFSFGVKKPIDDFVGRANILKELNDHFIDHRSKCVVMYAIGGQGKTELCKKFIQNLATANLSPPVVIWLPGESMQEISSSLLKVAQWLSIATDDEVGKSLTLLCLLENLANQIKSQFPTQRCLVVIDNVDEEYTDLENIIKILIDFEAFVLITSRRIDILAGAVSTTPLQLETLSPSDAKLLVKNSLKNASTDDVTLLCDKVGNHALALQQSIAYIRMQSRIGTSGKSYGISHFLQKFQHSQKLILQHRLKLVDYNHTIHAIVRTTLDSISTNHGIIGQVALELGIILGLVNPDGIHLDIIQKLHCIYLQNAPNAIKPSPTFTQLTEQAVLLLAKFSMLSSNDEVVSIHRLVQMVIRLEYENGQTINTLLKNIRPENASIEELRQLMSIWEHADHQTVKIYPNFAFRIFKRMFGLTLVLELSGYAEKNHNLLSQLLGPDHEETLTMEYSTARAIHENGDYETALIKSRTLHEKMKRVLGEEHLTTLATADLISMVLRRLKRPGEALEWKEKELECRVKVFGENHEDTMLTRNNKALILVKLDRMNEALNINQQVLEWIEVKLGSSHPLTLSTRHNIALIRFRQGQFDEARAEFETVFKLSAEVLGDEHANTLATKSWLASTYWKLGKREDAISMMEEVLISREKVLGHNHPHTNLARNELSTWMEEKRLDIPSLGVNCSTL